MEIYFFKSLANHTIHIVSTSPTTLSAILTSRYRPKPNLRDSFVSIIEEVTRIYRTKIFGFIAWQDFLFYRLVRRELLWFDLSLRVADGSCNLGGSMRTRGVGECSPCDGCLAVWPEVEGTSETAKG
jgi:hypothetical protein